MQHLRPDRARGWPIRRLPQLHCRGARTAAVGMDARYLLGLVDALTQVREREAVSRTLATVLGVDAVFLFVPDPARPSKLLPASGFAMPPAMRGWQELLAKCVQPGIEQGTVVYPDRTSERHACA